MKSPILYLSALVRFAGLSLATALLATSALAVTVDVLVVAGGGSGGDTWGGGGGGGGVKRDTGYAVTAGVPITITIGAGGSVGNNGSDSVFGSLVAHGGGRGGNGPGAGNSGGSGGGAGGQGGTAGPGSGTSGEGYAGGYSAGSGIAGAGGGGGAGGVGANANLDYAGAGGPGYNYNGVYYGGGGGGSGFASGGAGGSGGGGNGGAVGQNGAAGTANRGGGGGAPAAGFTPGVGGSGVVIVRYSGGTSATGGTITSAGGYTIHTFTSSGTFTWTPVAPVITSSLTAASTAGSSVSYTITATNTPTSFSATGLPTGLSLNTSTGAITGTPTVTGTINTSITATNAGGSDNKTLVWTIAAPLIDVTPAYTGKAILNGNVGIGTTNPTYPLAVNGTIRTKEIIVETGWADFVFDDDYALPSLAEVEAHIKAEKHLPGIPSAREVAAEGISLGEMQARLLQKIEELTLHQIAQEKRLASQDERIAHLEAENRILRAESNPP